LETLGRGHDGSPPLGQHLRPLQQQLRRIPRHVAAQALQRRQLGRKGVHVCHLANCPRAMAVTPTEVAEVVQTLLHKSVQADASRTEQATQNMVWAIATDRHCTARSSQLFPPPPRWSTPSASCR
jgi:hypothetical protein